MCQALRPLGTKVQPAKAHSTRGKFAPKRTYAPTSVSCGKSHTRHACLVSQTLRSDMADMAKKWLHKNRSYVTSVGWAAAAEDDEPCLPEIILEDKLVRWEGRWAKHVMVTVAHGVQPSHASKPPTPKAGKFRTSKRPKPRQHQPSPQMSRKQDSSATESSKTPQPPQPPTKPPMPSKLSKPPSSTRLRQHKRSLCKNHPQVGPETIRFSTWPENGVSVCSRLMRRSRFTVA